MSWIELMNEGRSEKPKRKEKKGFFSFGFLYIFYDAKNRILLVNARNTLDFITLKKTTHSV